MNLALISQINYDLNLVTYVDILDADPAYQNVEQILSDLISVKNKSQWLIGDLLVFLKYRTEFQTVKIFDWNDNFSPELSDFIRDRYKVRLDQAKGEREEFLCWAVIKFDKFWLLFGNDEVKVWEHNPSNITEQEFDQYLDTLTASLKAELGDNSLRAYYRTSRVFPPSQRTPHAWSYHYEKTNFAAAALPPEIKGEQRILAIQDQIPETNKEFDKNGYEKVADVRNAIKDKVQNERGWRFELPPPNKMTVIDTNTGEVIDALIFTGENTEAVKSILAASGIYAFRKGCELTLREKSLFDGDGVMIADIPNLDELVVAEAISYLADKMAWEIKWDE